MSHTTDNFPYSRVLIIGSLVQLAMALLLYMVTAIKSSVLIVLAVVALICLLLTVKVQKRISRVVVRIVFWGLPLLMLLFNLFTLIYMLVSYREYPDFWPDIFLTVGITATMSIQTTLMFAVPVLSVLAHYQQKRCDIFMLRLSAVLNLLMALFTCLYVINAGRLGLQLELGIDNDYYNVLYCLVCALTALCAMAAFPFKSRWLSSLFGDSGNRGFGKRKAQMDSDTKSE